MGHVHASECKKAKCEYLARLVRLPDEYWCTDCNTNVYNIECCGIIDEWYTLDEIKKRQKKLKGWEE